MAWDCWLCIYLIFQTFLIIWNCSLGVLEHHCCQPRGQRRSVCPVMRFEALSTVGTCTILSNSQNISKLSIFQGEGSAGLKSDHNDSRSKRCSLFSPTQHTEGFPQPLVGLEQTREGLSLFHSCKETPLTHQTGVWPRSCSTVWFLTPHTHSPSQ